MIERFLKQTTFTSVEDKEFCRKLSNEVSPKSSKKFAPIGISGSESTVGYIFSASLTACMNPSGVVISGLPIAS